MPRGLVAFAWDFPVPGGTGRLGPGMNICLSDEQIAAFVGSSASAEQMATWNDHIDRCDSCAARLAEKYTEISLRGALSLALAPGTKLGPYEIVAELGAGGMGRVFRARDMRLGREVAVKVLAERLANDAGARARFEREAKAVAKLSHPNILALYDVGVDRGISYAVTELLTGQTLRQQLREAALPWRKAVEHALAIANGLAAAHAKGIIHRDLKPGNIILTADGVVKILDFGLARLDPSVASPDDADESTRTLVTRPGVVLGTVNYMSPEQVQGRPTDARSDIFSFGCVLYELITNRRPFETDSAVETMAAVLRHHPPEPGTVGADSPPELDRVITRCLEKRPDDRFHSARDLAFTLGTVLNPPESSTATAAATAATPRPRRLFPFVAVGVILAILLIVATAGRWFDRTPEPVGPGPIRSIAVLPLDNLSGDPEEDYFADGMTEALITDLAKIGALRPISRTSVMRYKGTDKTLPEIARELNVDAVVEGTVFRADQRVRVTAQLIPAGTDTPIWAERYDRDLRDVLTLQSELARAIAQAIRIAVTPEETSRLARARRVDPEAHKAYLLGRHFWNRRTEKGFHQAIDHFNQAIEKDPTYAPPYAGLADSYNLLGVYGYLSPQQAFPKAKIQATKALEIDDTLGEAHASLAWAEMVYDWDWSGAERHFQRAIDLNPGYATGHHWYSAFLSATRRNDEAITEIERAWELDPLSPTINAIRAAAFHYARRYDQAIERGHRALDIYPKFALTHFWLGQAYEKKGMLVQAIDHHQQAVTHSSRGPLYLHGLGHVYAVANRRGEATEILHELQAPSGPRYVSPYGIALIHYGLGENDQVFEWLEKAYQERDPSLYGLNFLPVWDGLRLDKRFVSLLPRMNFEP